MRFDFKKRAEQSIIQGSLTNSKRPSVFTENYPTHVSKGRGCFLYDSNRKEYIDYICGLGTNLLGYADTYINTLVKNQIDQGTVYSLGSTLEIEAAEKLKETLHFIDKVRFLKTGTEAAMGAVRIALAHTGRNKVLSAGYHGWNDTFVGLTNPALGVLKHPCVEEFKTLDQIDDSVGCVIIEPIITDYSNERIQYLRDLREKCTKHGVVLIFDEIITGFRWLDFTVSNHYAIYPDILLLGKAIGGGLPLSAICVRKGIGEDKEFFISSTFAGDTLALRAMIGVIDQLNSFKLLKTLWDQGERFLKEFNELWPEKIKIVGYSTRGVIEAEPMIKALFFQEACNAGIIFGPSWFYNFHHEQVRNLVISTCADIISRIKTGSVDLKGRMPQTPFAQQQRGNK